MEENNIVSWTPANMLEVTLAEPDDFLKVRETLTRIGVASRKENKLFQSCHILHKQGRYFIVHFKELFMLDGKKSNLEQSDIERRNRLLCFPFCCCCCLTEMLDDNCNNPPILQIDKKERKKEMTLFVFLFKIIFLYYIFKNIINA